MLKGLRAADHAILAAIVAAAVGARLAWYSGVGLGDDALLRWDVFSIVHNHHVNASPNAYRFVWWLPSAVLGQVFGVGEVALIAPIVAADALGLGLVYALGHRLHGRAGAVLASLLVAVTPLDFAWATMLAGDIMLSALTAATVLCWLRALDTDEPRRRAWSWGGAALCLWLTFHAKVSAVLVVPALALVAVARFRRLDRTCLAFVATAAVLFGASSVVAFAFTGNPLAPLSAELHYQGLNQPNAPEFHRLTPEVWWSYPRWLFLPNQLGDLVFSVHAWAALALALLAIPLGLRTSAVAFVWFAAVFLGMQCNVTRYDGVWVAGFRNLRHAHVFVYPLALLVAGYLASLRRRRPRLATVAVTGLVAYGAWASITTANRTHPIFRQRRELAAVLAAGPPRKVYSDFQLGCTVTYANLRERGFTVQETHLIDRDARKATFATATDGYAVTGGGREPYYGCIDCIPRAAELAADQWALVREWPLPADPPRWWPEPMRLWERRAPPPGS